MKASWRTCVPSVDRPSRTAGHGCQGRANEVGSCGVSRVTARSIESSGMPLARCSSRPKHQNRDTMRSDLHLAPSSRAAKENKSADPPCSAVSVISFSMRLTRPHSSRAAYHGACRRQRLGLGSQTMHRSPPAETRRRIHGTRLEEEMKELNDSPPPKACGQRESLMT